MPRSISVQRFHKQSAKFPVTTLLIKSFRKMRWLRGRYRAFCSLDLHVYRSTCNDELHGLHSRARAIFHPTPSLPHLFSPSTFVGNKNLSTRLHNPLPCGRTRLVATVYHFDAWELSLFRTMASDHNAGPSWATKFTIARDIDKIIADAPEKTNIFLLSASSGDIWSDFSSILSYFTKDRKHHYVCIEITFN